jgi:hypothetical protein
MIPLTEWLTEFDPMFEPEMHETVDAADEDAACSELEFEQGD